MTRTKGENPHVSAYRPVAYFACMFCDILLQVNLSYAQLVSCSVWFLPILTKTVIITRESGKWPTWSDYEQVICIRFVVLQTIRVVRTMMFVCVCALWISRIETGTYICIHIASSWEWTSIYLILVVLCGHSCRVNSVNIRYIDIHNVNSLCCDKNT